ncbi:MAG: AAA family ATPase [Gammaproteobacteria bacterium]
MRDRFEAATRRGLTSLVGRAEEISLLLRRWEQAKDSEGQVVLVSGESGVGKSRILRGLQESVQNEPRNRVLYYCSPYHDDTPFHPVIDQLQRGLRFEKKDSIAEKLDKLDFVLGGLGLPVADLAPLFASLLSLPTAQRYPPLALSPEDTKKKTLEACVTIIEAMASQQPVLMIVEDLHWIDPSTLELLNLLVERLQSTRFLLVNTFRPDFEPPWTDQPHISPIILKRLSREESKTLITEVARGKALPDEVLDQIMSRTDGVPLFVEELTKTVLESDLLEDTGDRFVLSGPLPALAIPASLQDALMARLDRLAPVKEVAQWAATLGQTFSHELLAAIAQRAASALDEALSQLIDAELLYRRDLSAERMYEFKHAIWQDVAYNSLLRSKRQQLHREIACILEERFQDTVEINPELLAHHYREATLPERAIPYALRAGDAAAARYARIEATAHYQETLEMAQSLPPSENASEFQIWAILKLANVASNRQQFERDLKNLEKARSLAEKINDKHLLCQILYWIGRTNYVLGQFDLGIEYAEKSLQIAEALGGDDKVTADPVNLLARIHCLRGEPRQASTHAARNVEQMHKLANRIEEAAIAGVLAFAYGLHGRFPQAIEAAHRGVAVAQKTEHLPTIAACLMFRAVANGWYGDLESAVPDFEEALAVCAKAGDVFRKYLTHGWRGEAFLLAGRVESADEDLTECLALGDQIGTSFHRGAFQAFLAKIRLQQGDVEAALRISEEALKVATDTAQTWSRSIALRVHAEVLLGANPPDVAKAEGAIQAAIEIQEQRECRCDLAWSRLVSGQILAARGELEDARKAFAAAGQMFEETGITQGWDRTKAALAAVRPASDTGALTH